MQGSSFALASWFNIPVDASGPADDSVREEILMDAEKFTEWGANSSGKKLIVRTPKGRTLFEESTEEERLVWVDHVKRERWSRTRFWMNKTSVADLLDRIKSAGELQGGFDAILINE